MIIPHSLLEAHRAQDGSRKELISNAIHIVHLNTIYIYLYIVSLSLYIYIYTYIRIYIYIYIYIIHLND